MVGYAEDHAPDCYRFLDLETRKIIQSRDVVWTEETNGDESDEEIQETEDESETEDLVLRPPTTKQSNEENLAMNIESGEATKEKIASPVDQLQSLYVKDKERNDKASKSIVTFEKAMQVPKWIEAIENELKSIEERNVWKEIYLKHIPSNTKTVGTKWVFTEKHSNKGKKYKARLVVLGCYQIPGVDYTATYSPVAADSTIRVLLSVANYKGWEVKQIDVEIAFLNAELNEDVYLKRPKGYEMEEGKVPKPNRALYGLVQVPKAWMETFIKQVEILGYTRSWTDPCLMTKSNQGGVFLCMAIYVDDCLIAGKDEDVEETIQGIEKIVAVIPRLMVTRAPPILLIATPYR